MLLGIAGCALLVSIYALIVAKGALLAANAALEFKTEANHQPTDSRLRTLDD